MIKAFKNSSAVQFLIIALTVVVLWSKAFVVPIAMTPSRYFSPIYSLFYNLLATMPRLASSIALIMILAQSLWLNIILTNNKMTKAHSFLPMLLYLALMSWHHDMLTISPLMLANFFLIAASTQLLSDGTTHLGPERNFNAAFFLSMMVLCCLPTLYYIIPFIFVYVVYKLYRWRNYAVGILGLIAPFIVLLTYAFLTDKLQYYFILLQHDITWFNLQNPHFSFLTLFPVGILLLIVLVAVVFQLSTIGDGTTNQRINNSILSLPLLAALILIFYSQHKPVDFQTFAFSFAYIGTRFLWVERKRKWISEVLLFLILASILLIHLISN